MKLAKVAARWIVATAAAAVLLVVVAFAVIEHLVPVTFDSAAHGMGEAVLWRMQLFAGKAAGKVPELSWDELWQMARVRGGFGLGDMMKDGQSLDGSVTNPYSSDEDRSTG